MAVQDERVRLILEMLGRGDVRGASKEFRDLRKDIADVGTQQERSATQTRNLGLSMLMLSQAVEDAQYGLKGVLNNIPGLVLAMGGGPGLAGMISLASVAASQLLGNLDKITDWMSNLTPVEQAMRERRKGFIASLLGLEDTSEASIKTAVQQAIGGAGGGKGIIDAFVAAELEGRQNEELKKQIQENITNLIADALAGSAVALEGIVQRARTIRDPKISEGLVNALIGANEEEVVDKAKEVFRNIAASIGRAMQEVQPGAPGQTQAQAGAIGGAFGQRLGALGVSPEGQGQIGAALTGKRGRRMLAAMPIIMQMLRANGATEREIAEAIPKIAARMERGENVFTATQAVLNELARGGIGQFVQIAGMGREDMMAAQGAAMLGLGPGAFGPEQMSRFGGGAQFGAAVPPVPKGQLLDQKIKEFAQFQAQRNVGMGGLPLDEAQQAATLEASAERHRNLADKMERNAIENAKTKEEYARMSAMADTERQLAITQALQADKFRALINYAKETERISRHAAENMNTPATMQNNGRP
jgi:hypothetical protein